MASEELQPASSDPEFTGSAETTEPTPALPDYLASPNAVFGDEGVQWRYGRAPDYTKTRKVWAEGKTMNHATGSLPQLVENLVKNWEVEASFKPRLSDWRTVDHENYSFAMGGGPPQSAEHMIKVGTYNGIIAPNEYYSPENSDFNSSHKTFKRMMPTFAWEVLEVYSGPPRVAFRWRHWGVMKNDYVGFNNKGEKVTAKAHGGLIDIQGVTVAEVDDKIRLQAIQTWMDPLEMFRQIAPYGVVGKETMNRKVDLEAALDASPSSGDDVVPEHDNEAGPPEDPPTQMPDTVEQRTEPPPCPTLDVPNAGSNPSQNRETITALPATPENTAPDHSADTQTGGITTTSPITLENTAAPDHSEHAQSLDETSLPEPCAIETAAATYAAEIEAQKPESNATEVTQALPPAPVLSSVSECIPADKAGESIADLPRSIYSSSVTGNVEDVLLSAERGEVKDESKAGGVYDAVDEHLAKPAELVHPAEHEVLPAGHALAAAPHSQETRIAHEEMSSMTPSDCPFLQNRE